MRTIATRSGLARALATRVAGRTTGDPDTPVSVTLKNFRRTILLDVHRRAAERRARRSEVVSTEAQIPIAGLTVQGQYRLRGVQYEPSPWFLPRLIAGELPGEIGDWTFVDVGAGRGRMVMAAAELPFARVLGVEFALELQTGATSNVAAMDPDTVRAGDVDIELADATGFTIPDGNCVFYLFNPFDDTVLRGFLDNVVASWRAAPRPMRIVYYNPVHAGMFDAFREISRIRPSLVTQARTLLMSPHRLWFFDLG